MPFTQKLESKMQKFDASNSPEFVKEDANMPNIAQNNKTQGGLSTVPGLIPTPQNQQQAPAYSPNDAFMKSMTGILTNPQSLNYPTLSNTAHRQRLHSQDAQLHLQQLRPDPAPREQHPRQITKSRTLTPNKQPPPAPTQPPPDQIEMTK